MIEKTIYAACTIYSYEIKMQTQAGIQMKEGCIPMQHLWKRLKPTIDALTEHGKEQAASFVPSLLGQAKCAIPPAAKLADRSADAMRELLAGFYQRAMPFLGILAK